jgi:probable rRNA maturation factor
MAAHADNDTFSLHILSKGKLPRLPFLEMKNAILGKDYELSVVFIGDKRSRTLNKIHRGKDKPANVLSFPLEKSAGEIFLNPRRAQKEAPQFGESYKHFLAFLFIHGLLHLKGFDHGSKMESEERRFRKKFGL